MSGRRILRLLGPALLPGLIAASSARADVPRAKAAGTTSSARPAAKVTPTKPAHFDQLMSMIDNLFPAQPEPDPERLALARSSAQLMWPDGAYAKMMEGLVANIFAGVMQMKSSHMAAAGPKMSSGSADESKSNEDARDKAALKDPYFEDRMRATHSVIDEEIGKLSVVLDPRMREGLARAMAHRFDARQLADINAFFATSSGRALATEYVQLWFEPDALRSMMTAAPEMLKLMPDAMQKIKAINERFPAPKRPQERSTKH